MPYKECLSAAAFGEPTKKSAKNKLCFTKSIKKSTLIYQRFFPIFLLRIYPPVLKESWDLFNNFKFKFLKCTEPETWIIVLTLNNIQFLQISGKSLRNSTPPTILFSTPFWYFLTYIINVTHFITTHWLPTLACHPHHPR